MRQLLFIAGPTAIGKKTLADHLARDAGHCVREMLGIDGPVEKLGYPKGPDELYFGADVDTGLVMWQGAADSLIEQVGEQFPSVSRRIVSIWRPFDSHWRDYRDKTILYGAGLHRDAHAADWMELCLTHRRSIYHKLALHRGVEQVIVDASDDWSRLESLPNDDDPFTAGIRRDLSPLVAEISRLGLPGTDGAWLPYSSFTIPGFVYDRTYRDTRQRLDWFGVPVDLQGESVLELASHCGAISLELARRGGIVTGLERERESVAVANELANRLGVRATFREFNADCDAYPSEPFDIVFCGSLDHWINERDRLYDAVARLTRKVCYFESNEVSRHNDLDLLFASRFASVTVLPQSPGNRRLYVLKKV